MSYSFTNVALLSLNQEYRFFEAGFHYSTLKNFEIEGNLIDLSNTFGISGIWSGSAGLVNTVLSNSKSIEPIILNGTTFGTGWMKSITFDAGHDVQTKRYRASLQAYDAGNLFNLTGFYYSGINTKNFSFLQNFDENYAFNRKQNGGYSYNHNANVHFNSGLGNLNSLTEAQTLVKTMFTGSNLGFTFYSGYTNKQGKRFFTEAYNIIDSTCSFNEVFDFDTDSGNYSAIRSNVYSLDEGGIINVTENGTIRGIENPNFEKASNALAGELASAYNRCNSVFTSYAPANANALATEPMTLRKVFDLFDNNLQYTIQFTNNPVNSGQYFWSYTQNVNRSEGIVHITENGTLAGRGANTAAAYSGANLGFSQVKNTLSPRINTLYSSVVGDPYNFLVTKTDSFSPYHGAIGYDYQFSNEYVSGYSGVKRIEIVDANNTPNYMYNTLNIFNVGQILQDAQTSTVGAKNLRVRLVGEKPLVLNDYLNVGQNEVNMRLPSGTDPFVHECSYSYNPNENSVDLNVGWAFNRAAVKSIAPS
jgi:hypothetical protein